MSGVDAAQIVAEIDADVRQRLEKVRAALGRPLRVLHMGNIANNAYVNAKIMREYGIEADVVALDYYHVMGCPEWEEGVIEKLEGTQNDPDWCKTKTGNFKRPEWFLQGPTSLIAPYLTARAERKPTMTALSRMAVNLNIRFRGAKHGWRKSVHGAAWELNRLAHKRHLVKPYLIMLLIDRPLSIARSVPRRLLWLAAKGTKTILNEQAYRKLRSRAWYAVDVLQGEPDLPVAAHEVAHMNTTMPVSIRKYSAEVSSLPDAKESRTPAIPEAIDVGSCPTRATPLPVIAATVANVHEPLDAAGSEVFPAAAAADVGNYKIVAAPLATDIASFKITADKLREAFKYYDVVQGYAVDGIYPLLGGKADAYACYEHGTLRDIPYQPDTLGRICAHAYKNAPAVFITNTDCVASADNLGIQRARQFPIPHGFDSVRADRFRAENGGKFKPHNQPVTFIAPARHHWKNGAYVSWLKGNDVPIRAARLLADQGLDFKIIFVRWGQEIHESEALIAELGVDAHFEWIEPVAKARLWQYYLSCNGILDQFVIPAIGGVSFETLALGRPLFTRIDEPVFDEFFGRKPPLVNVHTPEGLADAMAKVIRDPTCYDQLAIDALEWGARYHSSARILQILLNGYSRFIPSAAPAGYSSSESIQMSARK